MTPGTSPDATPYPGRASREPRHVAPERPPLAGGLVLLFAGAAVVRFYSCTISPGRMALFHSRQASVQPVDPGLRWGLPRQHPGQAPLIPGSGFSHPVAGLSPGCSGNRPGDCWHQRQSAGYESGKQTHVRLFG
jgi:hypothetical protein